MLLYHRVTEHIIRTTHSPSGIEAFVSAPIISVGFVLFFVNKNFKRYGIGVTALLVSCIIFGVFFLNKSWASEGEYKNYKLRDNNRWSHRGFFLNVEFNMWYNSTEVPIDKWLQVDSVKVRIDKGFFGWKAMTNDLRIVESSNCAHSILDTTNTQESYYVVANELRRQRCFSEAINNYTRCIKLDSLRSNYFYERGLVSLVANDYHNALHDFLYSAVLRRILLDNHVDFLNPVEIEQYTTRLMEELKKQNSDIGLSLEYLEEIKHFVKYQKRIEFCVEKLSEM